VSHSTLYSRTTVDSAALGGCQLTDTVAGSVAKGVIFKDLGALMVGPAIGLVLILRGRLRSPSPLRVKAATCTWYSRSARRPPMIVSVFNS